MIMKWISETRMNIKYRGIPLVTEKDYHDILDVIDNDIFERNFEKNKSDEDLERIAELMADGIMLHDVAETLFDDWIHYETS